MNLTGIIPFLNIAGTSRDAAPLLLAIVAYVTFIYAGIKRHGLQLPQELADSLGRAVPLYIPIIAARAHLDLHPPPRLAVPPAC